MRYIGKLARSIPVGLLCLFYIGCPLVAFSGDQSFTFRARHNHFLGHCDGLLRLDRKGIAYETPHAKHSRLWSFNDIRHLEIFSPTHLAVETYGEPVKLDFELHEGQLTGEVYEFLSSHVQRGLTSRVLFPATDFLFQLGVRHRHRRGGCEGILRIGATEVVYETDDAKDRRIWRLRDVRAFGTTGPYDLRLSTEAETFLFDLKEPLSERAYDFLWREIYGIALKPFRDSH